MTCTDCQSAQTDPHWGGYHASCEGCQVRMLAKGSTFWEAKRVGRIDAYGYQTALKTVFGQEWEAAHVKVKAEHQRLRVLGGLA